MRCSSLASMRAFLAFAAALSSSSADMDKSAAGKVSPASSVNFSVNSDAALASALTFLYFFSYFF